MSKLADLETFLDGALCDTRMIKDFDTLYNGPVNDLPDHIDIRLFLKNINRKDSHDFESWEKNGIKSNLANILIAPEDYTEGNKKHFIWNDALEIEKKLNNGWRLPSRHEIALIAEEFGRNLETDKLESKYLQKNLGLGLNGYQSAYSLRDLNTGGYYWSRTAYSTTLAYYLYFNSTDISPAVSSNRYVGFSVRLVKDLEKNNGSD